MTENRSLRFAQTTLNLFGYEKKFDVEIATLEELESTAEAFRSLGCTVTRRNPHRLVLTVECPLSGDSGSNE